jgi:hypothetical protein
MRSATRTGRSAAGQGRFARTASASRFARTPPPKRGFPRPPSPGRRSSPTPGLRRRRAEPSGIKKVMAAVLPTTAAKKATPSSKKGKAGGLALVAAGLGMALKNRGKISELRHKDAGPPAPASTTNAASPPATPTS